MKTSAKAVIACSAAFSAAVAVSGCGTPEWDDYYTGLTCTAPDGEKAEFVAMKGSVHGSKEYTIFQISPPIDLDIGQNRFKAGKAYIAYYKPVMDAVLPEARDFYFAHECAHHRLGHGKKLKEIFLAGKNMNIFERHAMEEEADCAAAQSLRYHKFYDAEKMKLALSGIEGEIFSTTHPSGKDRVENAMKCAGFK